jgi:hypothetical protein
MLVSICFSCNDQTSNLGADFVQSSAFDIGVTDTLTLDVSTVLFDSLRTNAPDKLLLGRRTDEKLGTVTATPVFQLSSRSISQLDKNFTSYEALRLTMRTSGYYYYDTISPLRVSVYRVKSEIKIFTGSKTSDISDFYIPQARFGKYNNSSFDIESDPLGSLSFEARPLHTRDSIEIPLSDVLGKELFDLMQKGDEKVTNPDQFLNYLKGLAIIPDKNQNACFLGINPSIEMRLYYYDKSIFPSKQRYQVFSSSLISYNSIVADRSATVLRDLKELESPISSKKTGNMAFLQSGTGLGIRVQVPHLRNLLLTDAGFSASSAVLEMIPIQGYKTKTTPIPLSLIGYYVDGQNEFLRDQRGEPIRFNAVLVDDNENLERNKRYSVDITSFVNAQIATNLDNNNALLFTTNDNNFRNTIARLAVGDARNQYKMNLSLYFVTLPQKK